MRSKLAQIVKGGGIVMLLSCSDSSLTGTGKPPGEEVADKQEQFSNAGIERTIPLRVVHLHNVAGSTTTSNYSYDYLKQSIDFANDSFRSAGIQFYIRSIESRYSPRFYKFSSGSDPFVDWVDIDDEVQGLFPSASFPPPGWTAGQATAFLKESEWLNYGVTRFGNPKEIVLFIVPNGNGRDNASYGVFATQGGGHVVFDSGNEYRGVIPHELGHVMGLGHTDGAKVAFDPSTGAIDPALLWDLVYKPGTNCTTDPSQYFTSYAAANAVASQLQPIDKVTGGPFAFCPGDTDGHGRTNCPVDASLGCATWDFTHPGMKGMAFTRDVDDNPTNTSPYPFSHYKYGTNIMTYSASPTFGISTSQVDLLRKFIRYPTTVHPDFRNGNPYLFTAPAPGGQGVPTNNARRGQWTSAASFNKIDFDGNGVRDIAIWLPNKDPAQDGTFQIYLNGSTTPIVRRFGRLGDVPVPGNYRNDGRTDLAVFQPGGGANRNDPWNTDGRWRICDGLDCGSAACNGTNDMYGCSLMPWDEVWGTRSDVPIAGANLDNTNSTDELLYYRPSPTNTWNSKVPQTSSTFSISAGSVTASSGSIAEPVPDLYDSDGLTDLAVYFHDTGNFVTRLSTENYQFRAFVYPAFTSSRVEVVKGMKRAVVTGTNPTTYGNRAMPSLWHPATGNWYTVVNPTTGTIGNHTFDSSQPSLYEVCKLGQAGDIPLGGFNLASNATSGFTARAVHRPSSNQVILYPTTPGTCPVTGGRFVTLASTGVHQIAFAAGDTTGDNYADLWVFSPSMSTTTRYASSVVLSFSFSSSTTFSFGTNIYGYHFL